MQDSFPTTTAFGVHIEKSMCRIQALQFHVYQIVGGQVPQMYDAVDYIL
jgi:hypothetical protein